MPKFNIETSFHLPVFRTQSYVAETVEEACTLAIQDDDWTSGERDHDLSGAVHVTGVWKAPKAPITAP